MRQNCSFHRKRFLCFVALSMFLELTVAHLLAAHPPEPGDDEGGGGAGGPAVYCQAQGVVQEGAPVIWEAFASGGSGHYTYQWKDNLGSSTISTPIPGNTPVVSRIYPWPDRWKANGTVFDQADPTMGRGSYCDMYVLPATAPVEPPTVNPVLWLPRNADFSGDPNSLLPLLNRTFRMLRAEWFGVYGKTFRVNPVQLVVSSRSEQELCGGDCANVGDDGLQALVAQAYQDSVAQLGGILPYTREGLVLAWGAGAKAEHQLWWNPYGLVGEFQFAPGIGILESAVPPDAIAGSRDFLHSWRLVLWHELRHGIGWDSPHNFDLTYLFSDYERRIVQQSPWMSEDVADVQPPSVQLTAPAQGATLSGTVNVSASASDNDQIDAVAFLVDGKLELMDTTAPYQYSFDTTRVPFGGHRLTAMAFDATGHRASAERTVTVRNVVSGSGCSGQSPSDSWRACFYDGISITPANFIGEQRDAPFPVLTPNTGFLIHHSWAPGETIAFGQSDTVTGVWRGAFALPISTPNVWFRLSSDDGIRLYVNDVLTFDSWSQPVGNANLIIPNSPTMNLRVEWRQLSGYGSVTLGWASTNRPTNFVNNPPTPPVITPPVDPNVPLIAPPGEPLVLMLSASDPDGGAIRHHASQVMGESVYSVGASFVTRADGTATFTWIPQAEHVGKTFQFVFTVTDSDNWAASSVVTVQVPLQQEPVCELPLGNLNVKEGEVLQVVISCPDPQGGAVTYTATNGLPSGALLKPFGDANLDGLLSAPDLTRMNQLLAQTSVVTTAELAVVDLNRDRRLTTIDRTLLESALFQPLQSVIAWKPTFDQADVYAITIQARDPQNFTTGQTIPLTVRNTPQLQAIGTRTISEGTMMHFIAYAIDDQQPVGYGMGSALPAGAVFVPLGDINQDGQLTAIDYNTLVNLISTGSGSVMQRTLGDVTQDGQLTNADQALLAQYIALIQPWRYIFAWQPATGQAGTYQVLPVASSGGGASGYELVPIAVGPACFIATAAYGTPMAQELQTLAPLRDRLFRSSPMGRLLIRGYYRLSPPIAHFISDKPGIRALVRLALRPFVWTLQQVPLRTQPEGSPS